ncbi:cytochrome P450 [[Mycobacterium] vasticus]|uniref:Cytochrome P450 n=1 Tax=[Mycobacterium] vasticus TaxID=2875777 RepID=A0ABU5Z0T6_9MYCO|nr:cytochrome P450 [Mycolicibacter sp. MYC017]MEB3070696.1 cytochrome P450 [Mycolicibacter sp. MYC017]
MTDVQQDHPVLSFRYLEGPDPIGSNFKRLDELQQQARPFFRADEGDGYWVFTDHDAILEALQNPEVFSNSAVVPLDPNPVYKWIPMLIDPPEHGKWRHVLGLYFSPGRIHRLEEEQRIYARDLINKFVQKGSCDFYTDFAAVYPTTIFLQMMGLPIEKLPDFMVWEAKIMHATVESDPDRSIAISAMMEVVGYFTELINEKRADPSKRGDDIVSNALDWRIDDAPPSDADLLSCMLLLFMAGLDTVAAQLSYSMWHFATHPADRKRIVEDPAIIPAAIEEMMRAYPIVQTARKATRDIDFHGCPIKKDEVVMLPLAMAGRDPKVYARGGTVDLDADRPRHLSLGAGPHRCLGSHLARQELRVVFEEWHRLIPDYELADESGGREHTGGVYGVDSLPLRWTP